VKLSLREVLADSHVAAATIAVLLLWSLDFTFHALWNPLVQLAELLATAVAIMGIPFLSPNLELFLSISYLTGAVFCFSAAWLLARWVFGMGPLHSLSSYRSRLIRSNHA
jgi:hypothetical protein